METAPSRQLLAFTCHSNVLKRLFERLLLPLEGKNQKDTSLFTVPLRDGGAPRAGAAGKWRRAAPPAAMALAEEALRKQLGKVRAGPGRSTAGAGGGGRGLRAAGAEEEEEETLWKMPSF